MSSSSHTLKETPFDKLILGSIGLLLLCSPFVFSQRYTDFSNLPKDELKRVIDELEARMRESAEALEFEQAAALRDQILELRGILAEKDNLPPWEKVHQLAGED